MSWLRKNLGLDGFDLTIQVGVTVMLMTMVGMSNVPEEIMPLIAGASLVVLGIRRALVLRRDVRLGLTTGEMAAERIAELEQRVAELEAAQVQVAELEERVDFAERLLAAGSGEGAGRLPPAPEH
jgi:hypothetical protein